LLLSSAFHSQMPGILLAQPGQWPVGVTFICLMM
jgi:hypothetical protein